MKVSVSANSNDYIFGVPREALEIIEEHMLPQKISQLLGEAYTAQFQKEIFARIGIEEMRALVMQKVSDKIATEVADIIKKGLKK